MPVCQFFLQGDCRYGDKCWNTHPMQGRQSGFASGWDQNSGQRNVTFKDSFGTQNRLSALQQQPKQTGANQASGNIKDFTPAQLIDMVSQEMTVWERSKMWPFSCYAYAKETDCLPGFDDISPEELRIEAYTAEKAGTFNNYKQKALSLAQAYKEKRQQLHKPNPPLKQKLFEIIANNKNKSMTSMSSGMSGAVFGSSGESSKTGTFSNSGPGLFGAAQTNSGSVFGTVQTTQIAQQPGIFQNTVQGSASGPFANTVPNPFQSGSQTDSKSYGFMQQKPTTGSGNLFQSNPPSAAIGLFQQKPATTPGIFQQNTTGSNTSAAAGLFSQPVQPVKPSGLFQGKKIEISSLSAPQPLAVPAVTNPFGDSVAVTSNNNNNTAAASQNAQAVPGTSAAGDLIQQSYLYTPMDKLTKEELEEYKKDSFTLGKIPTKPPPIELIT